ncbi:serine/threonine-protein phosphatase 7 long form homolog [Rhododendron vialii]|uniref:serine/threonine-protein phosphatase 7 long form homolog n=1 Tax=Rhododendron vialii TaxID=182163 RepID=UPI00265E6194|nr:serine/threonine-protein phosphatase 7 long form homolog [Rhododendron vialii]
MDLDVDLLHSADPGPIDGSILVLQQQHRSQKVWDADRTQPDDCESMRIRRVESRIRKRKQPSPAIMDLIHRACLEGLCSVPFLSLDWALITALVERWHLETHTFHMRPGELTITLQDVEILLGIPVNGRPATGTTLIDPDDLCLRLLGEAPGERYKKGGKVKLKWLRDRFNGITRIYEVRTPLNPTSPYKGNHRHTVDFNAQTCTCNKMQQWRMPCSHVIAVCNRMAMDPSRFFGDVWRLASNIAIYSSKTFLPLRDKPHWPPYEGPLIYPNEERLRGRGRPQVNRFRNEMDMMDEWLEGQPSQKQSCSLCGGHGHNKRKCSKRGEASSSAANI